MVTGIVDCKHCDQHFGPLTTWAPVFRHMRDKHPEIWNDDAPLRNEAAGYGVE